MIPEELLLLSQRLLHRQVGVDVLLAPVDDTDEPELERVRPPCQDLKRVRAGVHEVELGEHADRPQASRIDGACELERVRVGDVDVRGRDGENHAESWAIS